MLERAEISKESLHTEVYNMKDIRGAIAEYLYVKQWGPIDNPSSVNHNQKTNHQ